MESVYQDEQVFAEEQLTPENQLRLQWRQQPGFIPFIRQKNVIDQNAGLISYAGRAGLTGWIPPLMFALQGLVLISCVAALLNWMITRNSGSLEEQITALQATAQTEIKRQEGIIAATLAEIARISGSGHSTFNLRMEMMPVNREQALRDLRSALAESQRSEEEFKQQVAARDHKLRAKQTALTIANSGTPLIFSLALVLAGILIGNGVQKDFARARQARRSKAFYLYFATAEGLWPNLVLLVFLHIALSRSAYGLSETFTRVGPLFWVVFVAGFYFLLLRYLAAVARGMYQALEIRPISSDWSPENRMLLRVHNSFLVVFLGMETTLLLICYLTYLLKASLAL